MGQSDDLLIQLIQLLRELGEGASGIVSAATDGKETVAIKKFKHNDRNIQDQEILMLKRVDHPNCIGLKKVVHTRTNATYLVMDYCSGGDLESKAKQYDERAMPEEIVKQLSKDDLRDLVEFLIQQKQKPKGPSAKHEG